MAGRVLCPARLSNRVIAQSQQVIDRKNTKAGTYDHHFAENNFF